MHIPDALAPLFETGAIERVVRPLMSGKEAQVYLVIARGELCVAKVYKEAQNRSFKHRADYTEGRKTRNSRDQRAIQNRSSHGRAQDEAAWRSTEVDMIRRLHAGGVRVPIPHAFLDGVLVMECVVDAEGNPAPRLGEVSLAPEQARAAYDRIIAEIVRMLSVGVVHGDLSPFNVLLGADGPVIIDFPQSVDAAGNQNARRILLRDVENMHRWIATSAPGSFRRPYAEEMWDLYESAALTAETRLTGRYAPKQRRVSDESVLDLVREASFDERKRRDALGLRGGPPRQPNGGPPRTQQGGVYQSKGTRTSTGSVMKLTPREGAPPLGVVAPPAPPAPERRDMRPDLRPQHQQPQQQRPPQQPRQHQQHPPQRPQHRPHDDRRPEQVGGQPDRAPRPPQETSIDRAPQQQPQPSQQPQRQPDRGPRQPRDQQRPQDPRAQGQRPPHQRPQGSPPQGQAPQREPRPEHAPQREPRPGQAPQREPRPEHAPRSGEAPQRGWTPRGRQSPGATPTVDVIVRRRGG